MRQEQSTLADSGNPWPQNIDTQAQTVVDGQEAGQTAPTTPAESPDFWQTSPPSSQTPPGPLPYLPGFPAPPPGSSAPTMMMEPLHKHIPLAWLAIVQGPGGPPGHTLTLGEETVVGRTIGQLQLGGDPAVSSQHFKVRLENNEQDPEQWLFVLYDLASRNGTYVGDRQTCQADESRTYRRVLQDGNFIVAGETLLVFKQV